MERMLPLAFSSNSGLTLACLLAQLGRGDHQVDANAQENDEQTRPREETLGAQLILATALGPDVRGVNW